MKKIYLMLAVVIFMLTACAPATDEPVINKPTSTTTPQASDPRPTSTVDPNLLRGNVYLDSMELLTLESYPLQFMLALKGNLPTPCNQLRVDVSPPDSENKILVDVYSVAQADMICAQMLQPFEENFPLGSFPAGHYTLWVNGKMIAEFDA